MDITIGSQYTANMRRGDDTSAVMVTVIATPGELVDYEFIDDIFTIRRGMLDRLMFEAFFTPVE